MRILKFCTFFWMHFAGLYLSEDRNWPSTLKSFGLNVMHMSVLSMLTGGSIAVFYYDMDKMNVNQILFAFLQITGCFSGQIIHVCYCFRKSELNKLLSVFQRIVDERFNDYTAKIYERAEWVVEMVVKWQIVLTSGSINGSLALATIGFLVFSLIRGEINVHTWPNLVQYK